ncbi:AMP-binding protein, partial [Roseibium sp. RKSG952]|uniref:AMP-binding protein n=1 Tax=Roseibium sp. RKSG952 TaxID=2529384 RepID=UPI0018AD1804
MYTSGSTGTPKGVLVDKANLDGFLSWVMAIAPDAGHLQMIMTTSSGFDSSLREMLLPILRGGRLWCVPEGVLNKDPQDLRYLETTALNTTPLVLEHLVSVIDPDWLKSLRLVYCGGAPLDPVLKNRVIAACPHADLLFGYGPTETTCNVTCTDFRSLEPVNGTVIGGPIPDTQAYIVDAYVNPVPVGVVGELLIGGIQVSRGYLGRAGLTAEKFIADPFSGEYSVRLYRTGDLARWRADATLEFLGRIDSQIKIRGMRVEPGEIEAVLREQNGISAAVVVARRIGGVDSADVTLVAYLVPDGIAAAAGPSGSLENNTCFAPEVLDLDGYLDLGHLRLELKKSLPDHMIPSRFVGLGNMPLTASGKVDLKALPLVEGTVVQATYEAPVSPIEGLVAEAFEAVIGIERAGRRDSFFELGGHSLSAVRLAARLERSTGMFVAVRDVFERPTVAGLAEYLDLDGRVTSSVPLLAYGRDRPVPLSFSQEQLWFLDRLDGRAGRAYHIENALRIEGLLNVKALDTACACLVRRHEVLRTVFRSDAAGVPYQIIHEAPEIGFLAVEDGSGLDDQDIKARVSDLLARPFNLETGPLFRATLIKTGAATHVFVLGGHHAVLDGWSLGVLTRELSALYLEA